MYDRGKQVTAGRSIAEEFSKYDGFIAEFADALNFRRHLKTAPVRFGSRKVRTYCKPLLYADRYEVELPEEKERKVPLGSRAAWSTLPPGVRCRHCGRDAANLCCMSTGVKGFKEDCICGEGDSIELCW